MPGFLIFKTKLLYMGRKFFLNAQKGEFSESRQIANRHTTNKLIGHIIKIGFNNTAYGETLQVHLLDENNFYCVSLFVNSRVGTGMFQVLKNIDYNYEVELQITAKEGLDYLIVKQFGARVEWYFIKDMAAELPRLREDAIAFYKKLVAEEIAPAVAKKLNPYPNNPFYSPASKKELAGGYFGQWQKVKMPNPVSSTERKYYEENGKGF